jgi:hypothetical protein
MTKKRPQAAMPAAVSFVWKMFDNDASAPRLYTKYAAMLIDGQAEWSMQHRQAAIGAYGKYDWRRRKKISQTRNFLNTRASNE